ncbi:MAG: hypothetical protein AVDCRST_MAG03-2505 [uncultured Rubrobacteraceae bacterium]|uniref:Uncharacterized protein n=1 Tax=uncultured Rubrobacteraceae bacterium TaxID=349277 RepID=A0A6J4PM74_9ACTN|nr:MAG: hypothetical protein AVDCRST_MAG03-2505 [uncultured Rubrobacteraceae bacterium]
MPRAVNEGWPTPRLPVPDLFGRLDDEAELGDEVLADLQKLRGWSRPPTWSARNGGVVRVKVSPSERFQASGVRLQVMSSEFSCLRPPFRPERYDLGPFDGRLVSPREQSVTGLQFLIPDA